MLTGAFHALDAERTSVGSGPVGLAWFVADRSFLERHPAADWPDSGFVYAGWSTEGHQARIRYFDGVSIA